LLPTTFVLGGVVLVVVLLAVAALHARGVALPADRSERVLDLARAAIMVAGAAAFTVCLLRWRTSSETAVLLIGTAVLVFAGAVVAGAGLVVPIINDGAHSPLLAATRAAGLSVFFVLMALAVVLPAVDTGLRPPLIGATAVAATLALAALLDRAPVAAERLAFGWWGGVLFGGGWVVFGLFLCALGVRQARGLWAGSGLMLIALAVGQLVARAADDPLDIRLLGGAVFEAVAMVFVLVGLAGELERTLLDQRARLFATQIAVQAAEARGLLGGEAKGRRRHDVGNALMAVQGAASTLERQRDRLGEDDRRRLSEMLATSVERLQRLVGEDPTLPAPFSLAEPVEAVMAKLEEAGVEVDVSVPAGLRVLAVRGAATNALEQMAEAVWSIRPEGPVTITARQQNGYACLSVGCTPTEGRVLRKLARRGRPPGPDDDVLGDLGEGAELNVAARMVAHDGGRLSASVADGRVDIRLELPAAPEG
jgi:signal transduction histidine kinase